MRTIPTVDDALRDILEGASKAQKFVKGMTQEDFVKDEKTVFAVIRALEIVGEAARRVPDDFRAKHVGVPWRSMTGMRDKLIHDYFGVSLDVVWKTVHEDLPALIMAIKLLGTSDRP
jgi:uncharacterized protein with HEPN domain